MEELLKLILGIIILFLGVPIGNFLARHTKEELKPGKRYFKILVFLGLVGGLIGLIRGNDVLLFTMFFIAIVTSRSLEWKNGKN